jgi:long-subunit fatty acid transport protein
MKKIILVLLLVIVPVALADSFYSSMGMGLPMVYPSAKSIGMGGAGIGVLDPMALNGINPAAIATQGYTMFSLDFQFESTQIENETSQVTVRDGNAVGFRMAFPVKRNINVAVGLKPHLGSKYKLATTEQVGTQSEYVRTLDGHGGLNAATIGVQYVLSNKLALAALANFYFGSYYEEYNTDFASSFYKDGTDELISHTRGIGFELGALYRFNDRFLVGAVFKSSSSLNTETKVSLGQFYSSEPEDQEMVYPVGLGIGGSYRVKKVTFALDLYTQLWSNYKLDGNATDELNDYIRLGGGLEYVDTGDMYASYFRRIIYRVGATYAQLPFQSETGSAINEQYLSFGFGFPFQANNGRIDIALEIGYRGNLNNAAYRENIARVSCSISGSELWFQRPKR